MKAMIIGVFALGFATSALAQPEKRCCGLSFRVSSGSKLKMKDGSVKISQPFLTFEVGPVPFGHETNKVSVCKLFGFESYRMGSSRYEASKPASRSASRGMQEIALISDDLKTASISESGRPDKPNALSQITCSPDEQKNDVDYDALEANTEDDGSVTLVSPHFKGSFLSYRSEDNSICDRFGFGKALSSSLGKVCPDCFGEYPTSAARICSGPEKVIFDDLITKRDVFIDKITCAPR